MPDFKFACPHCGQHLEASQELFGTVVGCPSCSQQIQVPQPALVTQVPPLPPIVTSAVATVETEIRKPCFYCCKSEGNIAVPIEMHLITDHQESYGNGGVLNYSSTTKYKSTTVTVPICQSCEELYWKMENTGFKEGLSIFLKAFLVCAPMLWIAGTLCFGPHAATLYGKLTATGGEAFYLNLVWSIIIAVVVAVFFAAHRSDSVQQQFPDYIKKPINTYPPIAELVKQGWMGGSSPRTGADSDGRGLLPSRRLR